MKKKVFLLQIEREFEGYYAYRETVRVYTTLESAQAAADTANEYEKTRPKISFDTEEIEEKTRRALKRWERGHPQKETDSGSWLVREVEIEE